MSAVHDREAIDKFVIDTLVGLGVDRAQVTKESSLDDLGVDSLDVVDLGQAIKKVLGIKIFPDEFETIETIGHVSALLYEKASTE
ncbi:MAG: acyl carrier protein [Pseudonocardiaceae bacterium]